MGVNLGTVGKVALIGAGAVGVGMLLAACNDDAPDLRTPSGGSDGPAPDDRRPPAEDDRAAHPPRPPRPQTPAREVVRDYFGRFDKRGPGISENELTRTARGGTVYGRERHWVDRDGYEHWMQRVGHRKLTLSMRDAWRAADRRGNNDGIASWAELATLAKRFDRDAVPGISRAERDAFIRAHGIETIRREVVWTHSAHRIERPDNGNGGGNGGGTSPGDDPLPGNGGGTSPGDDPWPGNGGGTSPGDDAGSGGGSGSTSPGDDHGGGSTSPGDDGGYPGYPGGGSSGGDSTDNGNPGEGDF